MKYNILVVDDNELNVESVATYLFNFIALFFLNYVLRVLHAFE